MLRLVQAFQTIQRDLYGPMTEIFYRDTLEEWIAVNIMPMLQQLQSLIGKINNQLTRAGGTIEILQRQKLNYENNSDT